MKITVQINELIGRNIFIARTGQRFGCSLALITNVGVCFPALCLKLIKVRCKADGSGWPTNVRFSLRIEFFMLPLEPVISPIRRKA